MYDIAAINSELGAYAREAHYQQIFTEAIEQSPSGMLSIFDIMDRWYMVDEMGFARATFSAEVMEYNVAWQPVATDQVEFMGDLLKLRDAKMDVPIDVNRLMNTWLNLHPQVRETWKNREEVTISDVPFSEWYFRNQIAKLMSEFRLKAAIRGAYAPGFTSFAASVDGVATNVQALQMAGKIPASRVVATGPMDETDTYDKLESVGDAIALEHKEDEIFMVCSHQVYNNYNKNHQMVFNGNNALVHDGYKRYKLRNQDNVILLPAKEMGTSQKVFTTDRDNIIWGSDYQGQNAPSVIVGPGDSPEELKARYKYSACFGFKRLLPLTTNDQLV